MSTYPASMFELRLSDAMHYAEFCTAPCRFIDEPLSKSAISPEQASIMHDMRINGFRAAITGIAKNPDIRQAVLDALIDNQLLTHIHSLVEDIFAQNKPQYDQLIESANIIAVLAFTKYKDFIKNQPTQYNNPQQTADLNSCIMQVLSEHTIEDLTSGFNIIKQSCLKTGWQIENDADSGSYLLIYEVNHGTRAVFQIPHVPVSTVLNALRDALDKFDIGAFARRAYQESHVQLAMDDSLDDATKIKIKLAELIAELTINTNA